MDALAAAALAVVLKESQEAALREALLDRERAAMTAEDLRSFVAQRHFSGSMQVPSLMRPMTWEAVYEQRHEDYLLAHDAMRAALRAQRQGDPFSRKWAQHLGGLQRHLGSGTQLPTLVQIEVRFHLFHPYLQ